LHPRTGLIIAVQSRAGPTAVAPMTSTKHQSSRLTADIVVGELRRNHFAVLSTVGRDGRPHSAGVNYGVSTHNAEITLYVMTRAHLQKARISRRTRAWRWWCRSDDDTRGFFPQRLFNCADE